MISDPAAGPARPEEPGLFAKNDVYGKGASPENDYTPTQPFTVELLEYQNSRDIDNYLYLYVPSGGADNPRQIQLRKKPSTGEWFIWVFQGLLMDIRIPVSEDKWA